MYEILRRTETGQPLDLGKNLVKSEGAKAAGADLPPGETGEGMGDMDRGILKSNITKICFSKNIKTIGKAHRTAIIGSKIVRLIFRDFCHETLFFS